MQFVIEKKMGKPESLPDPLDTRVVTKELAPSYVAALRFGGFPLDFEVTAAERRLREAVLRDGLEPKAGYRYVQQLLLSNSHAGCQCMSSDGEAFRDDVNVDFVKLSQGLLQRLRATWGWWCLFALAGQASHYEAEP
jgi:hypothetical protein